MNPLQRAQLRLAPQFKCKYCPRVLRSSQGHQSHVTRVHGDKVKRRAAPDAALSSLLGMETPSAAPEAASPADVQAGDNTPQHAGEAMFSIPDDYQAFSPEPESDAAGSDGESQPQAFVERFPNPVATPLSSETFPLPYQVHLSEQQAKGEPPYSPFADEEEWELARWIAKSGLSHAEID
ncbi:hypothetical protein AURDEDRAFT_176330 [Auricularia subglabra TFB-10046 SS5]|nr:hypothetical protein AURDEDRAFT_176330 [Auricularia subglabra TFB-10046 SS5]